jgi:PhnB protein
MTVKAIPEDFHSLTPSLIVSNSAKAIEFYQQAFGAKKRRMFNMPDEKTMYAEIQIGDSILLLTDEVPEMKAFSPLSSGGGVSAGLVLYVEDVDAAFKKAVTAGAKVTMPLEDAFWGDRSGSIVDPFGHRWMISKHIKDMSDEELEQAMTEMFAKKS